MGASRSRSALRWAGWDLPGTCRCTRKSQVSILLMLAGRLSYSGGLLLYRWHHLPFNNYL